MAAGKWKKRAPLYASSPGSITMRHPTNGCLPAAATAEPGGQRRRLRRAETCCQAHSATFSRQDCGGARRAARGRICGGSLPCSPSLLCVNFAPGGASRALFNACGVVAWRCFSYAFYRFSTMQTWHSMALPMGGTYLSAGGIRGRFGRRDDGDAAFGRKRHLHPKSATSLTVWLLPAFWQTVAAWRDSRFCCLCVAGLRTVAACLFATTPASPSRLLYPSLPLPAKSSAGTCSCI